MNFKVRKSFLSGSVRIPGSKSHTIRGIICATLAEGMSVLKKPLFSDDTLACRKACEKFGARIKVNRKTGDMTVQGTGGKLLIPDDVIDVMNSGTTLYFTMGLASLIDGWTFFTGDAQIRSRPVGEMMRALQTLKARGFSSRDNDRAPLALRGLAQGGRVDIRARSSQYLSTLLLCCPLFPRKTRINVLLLNEKPYVDMTLSWLKLCGIHVTQKQDHIFEIPPGQKYRSFRRAIPADFSSAAFFIAAAALFARDEVCIKGLDMDDVQGDKALVDLLRQMNASIVVKNNNLIIKKRLLKGIRIDITDIPDLLPILSVLGCYAEGETVIYNGEHVRQKETDRIAVMAAELRKMGASVRETQDGLIIKQSALRAADVKGHHDHRVVMSLAVAAMGCAPKETLIRSAEAVSVTFPDFFDLMKSLGGKIKKEMI